MASEQETAAMRDALDAARSHPHRTLPNPRVGCVLLTPQGETVATGVHRGAGQPHAEVDALRAAGTAARGTTAVVTLEPCDHTGRTGPCSVALVDAGVARVVFAQADPNPDAAGGADRLRAAGVDVEVGVLAEEARAVNEEWTFAVRNGRPYVTWKLAATLDGRSAAADGTSRWITSEPARRDVQRRRAEADAVVVGTGTILADDPRLTLRDQQDRPLARDLQPLRVAVGERDVPADARVRDDAADFVHLRTREVAAALDALAAREVRHVWLEGGPALAGAFVAAGLVDRVVAYVAPALLGAGTAALGPAGVDTITGIHRLEVTDVTTVGPDIRITARAGVH